MTISGNMHGGLFAEGIRKLYVVVGVEPKRDCGAWQITAL